MNYDDINNTGVVDVATIYAIMPKEYTITEEHTELDIKKAKLNIDEVLEFEGGDRVSFDIVQDVIKIISILAHRTQKKDAWKKCKYYVLENGLIAVRYDLYTAIIAPRSKNPGEEL